MISSAQSPALDLYRLLRDPHSAFDIATRSYSFMTIGPVSPSSFSGTPLFLNAYNTVEDFMRINQLKSVDSYREASGGWMGTIDRRLSNGA